MVFLISGFVPETAQKRLDLKSLKEQTKAEELERRWPEGFPRLDTATVIATWCCYCIHALAVA
jgi:hypothetical protein